MFQKIKEFVIWFTSKKVRAAINAGASYEEVAKIVRAELTKEKTAPERPFQKRLKK